jgi:hypothetical protein
MSDRAAPLRANVSAAILDGPCKLDRATRRQAYDGALPAGPIADYATTVRRHAYRVDDELVAAARRAGLDDEGLFEVAVAAAVGQATRQLDAALAALDAALAPATSGEAT